jgi:uncharacterized protein (TIGR02421 family)
LSVTENDLALDRAVFELCGLTPLLSMITPTNVGEAKRAFYAGREPEFEYRPLPDIEALQERLDEIRPERADDPAIGAILEGLTKELNLRLEMLRARESEQFFLVAVEMFGQVDQATLDLADEILAATPAEPVDEESVSAQELAELAQRELDHYRSAYPELTARVEVSSSRPGVMVETGILYVGHETEVARNRIQPLLHHEVGTHLLTFENGRAQPLHMLAYGLAGYDELQEALGVLAEHLSGGIPPFRLRVLAYRVVAARCRSEGAEFRDTFDRLRNMGAPKGTAFNTSMRAYRGGGMTKDTAYLRGLNRLLQHLAEGGNLETLYLGKLSFESISLVADLRDREVIVEPPLIPRFLTTKMAKSRLAEIQQGRTLLEIEGVSV